jgi:hypothetical protein
MKNHLFIFCIALLQTACSQSNTNYGESFIGVWQSVDDERVRFEIVKQVREGRVIEKRYELNILSAPADMPPKLIEKGQYNYQLVTGKPENNSHPFMEFIHKNSFNDTLPFLGLNADNSLLIRRFRKRINIPEAQFRRVK